MLILYAGHYKPPPVHFFKYIYSEKAKKFCKIFTLLLTVCTVVKSKVKISQNCVAFSENMNFICLVANSENRIECFFLKFGLFEKHT